MNIVAWIMIVILMRAAAIVTAIAMIMITAAIAIVMAVIGK